MFYTIDSEFTQNIAFINLIIDRISKLARFVIIAFTLTHYFAKTDNNELTAIWRLYSQQVTQRYYACANTALLPIVFYT